jgi:hypothetical protein
MFRRYLVAKELARTHQDARTRFLMKEMHLGHGAAAKVMDLLETAGVVRFRRGSNKRESLIA